MNDQGKASERAKPKLGSTRELRQYTQQIWLAGLGAFARAEEEGGKLFENLLKVGEEVEAKARDRSDVALSRVEEKVEEVKIRVKEQATDTIEKVEKVFDDRLVSALHRMGIPSRKEVEQLNSRLEELTMMVGRLLEEQQRKKD